MEDILLWWKICMYVKRLTVTHRSTYAHTRMRVHAQCRQKLRSAICFSSDQSRWKRMMICLLPQGQNLDNSFKAFGNLYQVWISTSVAKYSECEAFVNIHTHMRALVTLMLFQPVAIPSMCSKETEADDHVKRKLKLMKISFQNQSNG